MMLVSTFSLLMFQRREHALPPERGGVCERSLTSGRVRDVFVALEIGDFGCGNTLPQSL